MATRKGVGEINELIKLEDEFQISSSSEFIEKYEFETKEEAESFKIEGKVMNGKARQEDGKWYAIYSPVGEMVVKCIERAARMMGCPLHLTGDYLCGFDWSETH